MKKVFVTDLLRSDEMQMTSDRRKYLSRMIAEMQKRGLYRRYRELLIQARRLWVLDCLTSSQRFNIASWVLKDVYDSNVKKPLVLMHHTEVSFYGKKIKKPRKLMDIDIPINRD